MSHNKTVDSHEINVITPVNTSHELCEVKNAKAVVIFAHGAGADMHHHYIEDLVEEMNSQQLSVLRFNFPYMDKRKLDGKRRPPDRMPKLVDCYKSIIANFKTDLPIIIAGKSMGGRVAATLAGDKPLMDAHNIKGVICLGYPFPSGKKTRKITFSTPARNTIARTYIAGRKRRFG